MTHFLQEPSEQWKKQHVLPGTSRIEGFDFQRDVGEAPLSLTNFSAHRDTFDPVLDKNLTVYFVSSRSGPFRVTAREITPSLNYWMEDQAQAKTGTNRWSEWSTEKLRKAPKPIDPTNIGVVVYLLDSQKGPDGPEVMVAPAILRRPGADIVPEVLQYDATFLPDTSIAELSFKVLEGCGTRVGTKPVAFGTYGNQYQGRSVAVPFTVSKPGLTTLRIEYKLGSESAPALNYCFWHVPRPGSPPSPPTAK